MSWAPAGPTRPPIRAAIKPHGFMVSSLWLGPTRMIDRRLMRKSMLRCASPGPGGSRRHRHARGGECRDFLPHGRDLGCGALAAPARNRELGDNAGRAPGKQEDPIREPDRVLDVMGHENRGHMPAINQGCKLSAQPRRECLIERDERLVKN